MRRNARPGFLAVPHELDDLPLWDGDLALKGVFLLLCHWAHHAPGKVQWKRSQHDLARGELVTSSNELATKTGLSRNIIRRCIATLQREGLIGFRQKITDHQADAEKNQAKHQAETVYIINNYDGLFCNKKSKPPSKPPSSPQKTTKQPDSLPLYTLKNNTHTDAGEGVCATSADEGKPAEPSQAPVESSFLTHPLVIEWNGAASAFKLAMVSEATPARLRAMEAALRARSDLSWWRVVFDRAGSRPIKLNGLPWRPSFDQCLQIDRAVLYWETAQKFSHLKPVPNHIEEKKIGPDSSREGNAGAMPPRQPECRPVLNRGDLVRQLFGGEPSNDLGEAAGADPGGAH